MFRLQWPGVLWPFRAGPINLRTPIPVRLAGSSMHTRTLKLMACLVAALTLTLAACRGPEADPAANLSPEARARTVPIVRPFKLVPMEEPLVVEFDALPPGPNASSWLSIGIWVKDSDGLEAIRAKDIIERSVVEAEVHLTRFENGGEETVTLQRQRQRSARAPGDWIVAVGKDGRTNKMGPFSVDSTALVAAGLASETEQIRALDFASVLNLMPGTYRLSIRLVDPPEELSALDVDLLVAYKSRAK